MAQSARDGHSPTRANRMIGIVRLSPEGARVIGSLVEKEMTTPDQYPLTIKSLVAACNQASNRDPVVNYDEGTVLAALAVLKEQKLVRFVLPSHGRSAVRYRHVLPEALALDPRQSALVAVLLLRGPQTVGELRSRTDRMVDFDTLDEVEHELVFLSHVEESLATKLDRKPGQKEERWICPLVAFTPAPVDTTAFRLTTGPTAGAEDRIEDLREELTTLRSEIGELRRAIEELRESLGG